ncbi:hypothetical protein HL658_21670 [Azospirillum sp. RWY-5-1]|uniref:YfhO family protein n=1 Tax=Azospirillum oleiclasticum TaxID=2735135 RepID=A0ABX2TB62_9PROT|nr:hypothetical protein [Azospirillum oleiclasticum]NYZ15158.1 hypothetical protein [Azospirillum oleiclasticum]NYZ21421.1 hypothetical protein [Azospirillum oleiclasticum]
MLLAVVGGGIAELTEPGFFFRDDMQHYFMPMFMEIGRQLADGSWPSISLRSWFGGNLVGEYQYALYNPVSLLLYWVIHRIPDPAKAAFLFSVFHLALGALGTFFLARTAGLRDDLALAASVTVATNSFVVYWFASSWVSHLVAFAWSTWAMFFLLKVATNPRYAVPAVAAIHLTLTSGFPQAAVALSVWGGVLAGERWCRTRSPAPVVALAVCALSGILVSLPAILPVAAFVEGSARPEGVSNTGFNTALLGDLLKFSFPSHVGLLNTYGGFRPVTPPIYLTAWFALPVLVTALAVRHQPSAGPRWSPLLLPLIAAVCFGVLAQGPDQLGPFRYPFRFLPWFHVCVTLACLAVLDRTLRSAGSKAGPGMPLLLAAAAVGIFGLSVQQQPDLWRVHAVFLALQLAFSLLLPMVIRRHGGATGAFLVATSLCVVAATHLVWPHTNVLGKIHLPEHGAMDAGGGDPRMLSIQLAGYVDRESADAMEEAVSGNTFLLQGGAMINGYSPIMPKGLAERLCMGLFGWTCPDAAANLFRPDPETGMDLADLARLGRIMVQRGDDLDAFRAHKPDRWAATGEGRSMVEFRRRAPLPSHGGYVSWLPPGVTVESTVSVTDKQEVHRLRAGSSWRGGRLVLARAAYPGYRAELDGRPLPVEAHLGVLVSVVLPADTSGELRVWFEPPGQAAGRLAAGAGLVLLAAWLMSVRLKGRRL